MDGHIVGCVACGLLGKQSHYGMYIWEGTSVCGAHLRMMIHEGRDIFAGVKEDARSLREMKQRFFAGVHEWDQYTPTYKENSRLYNAIKMAKRQLLLPEDIPSFTDKELRKRRVFGKHGLGIISIAALREVLPTSPSQDHQG